MSKKLKAAVLGGTALLCALLPGTAAGADIEIVDGSFFAKTHEESIYPTAEPFFDVGVLKDDALTPHVAQAGAHPEGTTSFSLTERLGDAGHWLPTANVKDVEVDLPAGFYGDPFAVPACDRNLFLIFGTEIGGQCEASSQVGIIRLELTQSGPRRVLFYPVYNVVSTPGVPAALGFRALGQAPVFIDVTVRDDGDYGLRATSSNITSVFPVFGATVTIWGRPADPRYDNARWDRHSGSWGKSLQDVPLRPFLVNASDCRGGPLESTIRARSWSQPDSWSATHTSISPEPEDCERLTFQGQMDMQPSSRKAETPSGFVVDLTLPYNRSPEGRAFPPLRKAVVKLPEGVTVSPGAARGLGACTTERSRIGRPGGADCPESAKLATVEVETPLLEEPLRGAIYQAMPYDNPFGSLLALYLVIDNENRGVHIKLAGRVETDPVTGQITGTFDDNPQFPFTDMRIRFFGGPGAALVTPEQCGRYETVAELTPWSAPESGPPVVSRSSFVIDREPDGSPCPESGLKKSFDPWFESGTTNPIAAAHSDFATLFGREDRDHEIDSIALNMPQGLVAKIRGVELCPSAAADAGTCPADSRIGRVVAAAGPGPAPLWVPEAGKSPTAVYLSGPYEGAPYSLSVAVPAQAGSFDLGRIVVRAPIHVDERTAELSVAVAKSRVFDRNGALKETIEGAMPRILEGIPLRVREVRVVIDRDEFILNPTSCRRQQVDAKLGSPSGMQAEVSDRFGVAGCAALGFAPKFRARILDKGRRSTLRSWHPRTKFTVVPRLGDANIGGARVALPSSTILDQGNIGTTCTRARMAARDCPAESIVGYAKAWSPLLNRPIEGPVFLAANGGVRPLPDLAAVLDGEVRIMLTGEISTLRTGRKARLQNTFRVVPDAPVNRFVLTMRGGKNRGLLVNSTDLCRSNERGVAVFIGQNGKRHRLRPRLGLSFKGCGKVRRQAARRASRRERPFGFLKR